MKKVVNGKWLVVSKFVLLTFVSLSLITAAFAQGKTDVSDQISLVSEFDVNGLKVIVKRRPSAATVAAGLFVRGGARNISDKNAGVEYFMLDAATEGSKIFPREAIRRELASTGSGIGASVANDYSVLTFGSTLEHFDKTWNIFVDVAMNPTFEKDDLERTREKLLTSLRGNEDEADDFLQVLQDRVIYANHPYFNNVRGTLATIQNFTPNELNAYHRATMQTSKLLLVVVGDLSAADVKKKVEATLGKLPRGNYKEMAFPALDFSKATLEVSPRTLPTNYIQGVFNAPSLSNTDYYAMRVAITILRNRLFEEVRERRQLSYAPSASLNELSANTGNIYVTAVDANQTISVMLDEIKKLRNQPVSEGEISGVAGQFLTTYYLDQETNAAQAAELAKYELIGGGWQNSFEFLNRLIDVNPQRVQAVSQKYLKNLRFIVVGNPVAINKEIFLQNLE
ncbi:MAG: insulinase family protein [Acidobacteriota bacterium]|jgi:zinc protease|nr:insulinase family protein [Acidobacteriota bacterium]